MNKIIKACIQLMRPTQWIKNGFVLMPLIFSGRLLHPDDIAAVSAAFIAFCLSSSATYIFNDYADIEQDKAHPKKKFRPLARGDISPASALAVMCVLIALSFAALYVVGSRILNHLFLAAYLGLQILYSLWLKHVVILDVLALSMGFLLRVLSGAAAISVAVSSWLFLCTFSIATFLALGKRRHEVVILNGEASHHRPVLESYSIGFLDQLLQVVTTSTFVFYCLYAVRGNPGDGLLAERMMLTIPFVTYGIFRYLYLIYLKEDGGSPTALLLTDRPLLVCVILWLAACVAIIYF